MNRNTLITLIADFLSAQGSNTQAETMEYYNEGHEACHSMMLDLGYNFSSLDVTDFEYVWSKVKEEIDDLELS